MGTLPLHDEEKNILRPIGVFSCAAWRPLGAGAPTRAVSRVGVAAAVSGGGGSVPSDQTRASVQLDGTPPTSYAIRRLGWPLVMRRAPGSPHLPKR